MAIRIQIRHDSSANWIANNPSLREGEFGVETDTLKIKIGPVPVSGDSTPWNSITAYANVVPSDFNTVADGFLEFTDIGSAGGVVGLNSSKNAIIPGSSIIIEGPTNDSYETTLTVTDPTADRTLTLPDVDGTIATEGYVDSAISAFDALPTQTGNNGKYLQTNGSTTQWATLDLSTKQDKVTGVSDTEIGYLDGVTSAIQTQLNSKASSTDLSNHESDTTNIHGIADTSALATKTYADSAASTAVSTHESDTTNIHGIADTSALATKTYTDNAVSTAIDALVDSAPSLLNTLNEISAAINDDANFASTVATAISNATSTAEGYADGAITTHNQDTTSVHGIADTSALATKTYADNSASTAAGTAENNAKSYADGLISTEVSNRNSAITTAINAISTSDIEEGTNLYYTTERAQDDSASMITNATHSGVSVAYTDNGSSAGTLAITNTGVTSVSGTSNEVTVSGSTGSVTIGLPDNVTIAQKLTATDVEISGALTFTGTATQINTTDLAVTDSLIYLASEQFDTDILDIGIYGAYGDSNAGHFHTGLIRDASDGKWKLVSGGAEPSSNTIDFTGVTYDTLKIGSLEGNVTGNVTGNVSGNAGTVTNGVYTTDSGTVTNTMLAGSIANNKLSNSTISGVSLGSNLHGLTIGTGLSGTSYNGSADVTIAIDSTVATLTGSQTLTGKTISGADNTLSNIGNSSLTNSKVTVNGTDISLGASATITAAGSSLTGTSLATNILSSSLTSVGTLTSLTTSGNVTVGGDLTVNGTTTTVNSTTLDVSDKNITISKGSTTDSASDGAGITIKATTDKTFNWVNATGSWTSSENVDLASGKVLKIAGTQVLSATEYTGNAATVTNGVYTSGSYSNPSWITGLAWSKISSTPTTISGYGITNAVVTDAANTITAATSSTKPLILKGTTSQSANLQEWQNSSGTVTAQISPYGAFTGAEGSFTTSYNGTPSLTVNAVGTSQTADLQQWKNSSGTILSKVDISGNITAPSLTLSSALATTSGGTGLSSYTSGDIIYASATNTLSKLAKGTDGQILTLASGVPSWAAAPAGFSAPTIGSTSISSGATVTSISGLTLKDTSSTTISLNTATTVDTNALSGFTTAKYVVSIKQGSKIRSSEVIVQTDGTSVDLTEFGITETGGTMTGVVVSATTSSTNAVLQVTITDASSTNATVKINKILI